MTPTTPMPVHIAVADSHVPIPAPAPRHSPQSAARAWQSALLGDADFELSDGPGGLVVRFVEPVDLSAVRDGEVAVVDWPRDTSVPAISGRPRAIVTHTVHGARSLERATSGRIPVAHIPVPGLPLSSPGGGGDELAFSGWAFDSQAQNPAQIADQRIGLDPGSRVITLVADAQDADRCWADALFAFTESFRDRPDLTVVVWMTHSDPGMGPAVVEDVVDRSAPYVCRVIVGVGQMSDAAYRRLIDSTDLMVAGNDSDGGLRPLLDFMSGGVPATGALGAYPRLLDDDNCLSVNSYTEVAPSLLSDEPRLTRMRSIYDWPSLASAMNRFVQLEPRAWQATAAAGARAADRFRDPAAATRELAALITTT